MKLSDFVLVYIFLFTACQSPVAHIEGRFNPPMKSRTLELCQMDAKGNYSEVLDTATIHPDGSFSLRTNISPARMTVINLPQDYQQILLYAENLHYRLTEKDGKYYFASDDSGSLQNRFIDYMQEAQLREETYNRACAGYDTIRDIHQKAELSTLLASKFKENEAFRLENIRTFAGTEIAQYIIYKVLYYYENDYNAFSRAIGALGDSIPESAMKTAIFSAYGKLKAAQLTGKAPAFTLEDDKGVAVSLSDFRGKYVLIDFWASWCAPCRAKNKELFKQYPQFQKAGMEVISISLDDNKEKWLEAIRTDGVNWIQLSDLKGFKESKVARDYKIKQVPTVYLIGPEGDVIKTNPTVEEIKEMLVENKEDMSKSL